MTFISYIKFPAIMNIVYLNRKRLKIEFGIVVYIGCF